MTAKTKTETGTEICLVVLKVPTLAVSVKGNFDQSGMNISVQPTITPTGTSNSLPIGPTVDWDVDFGNPLGRDFKLACRLYSPLWLCLEQSFKVCRS